MPTIPARTGFVRVVYRRRGRITFDEVICRRHFEERERQRVYAVPSRVGQSITVEAWRGEQTCAECER